MASRLNSGPGLPRGRLQVSRLTEIIHQRVPSMASSRPDGESGPPPRCQREPHLPVPLTTSLPMLVVSAPSVAREKPPREEDSIVQLVSELPFRSPLSLENFIMSLVIPSLRSRGSKATFWASVGAQSGRWHWHHSVWSAALDLQPPGSQPGRNEGGEGSRGPVVMSSVLYSICRNSCPLCAPGTGPHPTCLTARAGGAVTAPEGACCPEGWGRREVSES